MPIKIYSNETYVLMTDLNSAEDTPVIDSMDKVQFTVLQTLFGMIRSFIGHVRFPHRTLTFKESLALVDKRASTQG